MDESYLIPLVSALAGSGLLGFIIALMKVRSENQLTTVRVVGEAVLAQKNVIDTLKQECERLAEAEEGCQVEVAALRCEVDELRKAVAALDERKQQRRSSDPTPFRAE